MAICEHGSCFNAATVGNRCETHSFALLAPEERLELMRERFSEVAVADNRVALRRRRLRVIGSGGLALAGSALAVGLGAGSLGVLFAVGLVVGVSALLESL
jgi:hypothetical protein